MVKKRDTMVRVNSRVTPEQLKFIKDLAKKLNKGEGELHREIIQFYIDNNKK